jgi:hypothetical protein
MIFNYLSSTMRTGRGLRRGRRALVLLGVLATYWMPVAAHAEGALAGIQTRHVLVATPERALDVARPSMAGIPLFGGIVEGLIAEAIRENRELARWKREREILAPLAEAPEVKLLIDSFQKGVAEVLAKNYGVAGVPPELVDSERSRQRQELQLAPDKVLSATIFNTFAASRCGRLGVYLAYGSGYMKQTQDIKRKKIEVYVPRHERTLAVVSDWCLPDGMLDGIGSELQEPPLTVEQLLAHLEQASTEVLDALRRDPLAQLDEHRVGTHGMRFDPYVIVEYHAGRTLVASEDRHLLRWIPAGAMPETRCNNACGPLRKAQAEERARRAEWQKAAAPTTD